jgi:hypothetical protein
MNNKGIFITFSVFFITTMLLLMAANTQSAKNLEEKAIVLSLASEKSYFVKQNVLGSAKEIYKNAGIDWNITDNNFVYYEFLPNTAGKSKILANLLKLKAFFYQEFPQNSNFNPNLIDYGQIIVYNKDFNITHADTNGFGTNKNIYFNASTQKFNTIRFDVNANTNALTQVSQSFPLCSSCSKPLRLIVNVKNSNGTSVTAFNNIIDFSQVGSLVLGINPPTPEVSFFYTPTQLRWNTVSTDITLVATITFDNELFQVGLDRNLVTINEMNSFGIE